MAAKGKSLEIDLDDVEVLMAQGPSPAEVKKEEDVDDDVTPSGAESSIGVVGATVLPTPHPLCSVVAAPSGLQTPAKKRRRRSDLGDGSPSDNSVAKAVVATCTGCGRSRDSGRCFRDPRQPIVWAYPDGRGLWCLGCHTTWRTMFSQFHTLALFTVWLREPDNLATFLLHALAFQTFDPNEGLVRHDKFEERVGLIRLILQLLGVPPQAYIIRMLDAGDAGGPATSSLDPRALVPVQTANGLRWGVFAAVDSDVSQLATQPFLRSFFNLWQVPPPVTPEDREELETMGVSLTASALLPAGSVPNPLDLALGSAAPAATAPKMPASREHAKFQIWVGSATKLMGVFASDDWQSFKESSLKGSLAAVSQFLCNAGTEGHGDIYEEAQQWVSRLSSAKKVLSVLREHNKMKKNPQGKLSELAEPFLKLEDVLRGLGVKPAASFKLFALRANLYHQSVESRSMRAAFQVAIDRGLANAFEASPSPEGSKARSPSASLWLRSVLAEILKPTFPSGGAGESALHYALQFHDELQAVRGSLEVAFEQSAPAEFFEDLNGVCIVLRGLFSSDKPAATSMKIALERINSSELHGVREVLRLWPVWQSALLAAAGLVQASSKDGLADSKMARAVAILEDGRLPHLSEDEPGEEAEGAEAVRSGTVCDAGMMVNGTVHDAVEESLSHMSEAAALWSDVHAESKGTAAKGWADSVVGLLTGHGELQWLSLSGRLRKAGLIGCEASNTPGAVSQTAWDQLVRDLEEFVADEELDLKLCKTVQRCFAGFRPGLKTILGVEALTAQVNTLEESFRLRGLTVEVAIALASVGPGASSWSPAELVADWRAKKAQESSSRNALLYRILAAMEAAAKLKAHPGLPVNTPQHDMIVKLEFDEKELHTTLLDASAVNQSVLSLPLLVWCGSVARGSLEHILHLFAEAVCLTDVCFALQPDGQPDNLDKLLRSFIVSPKMPALAKIAARYFSPKGGDAKVWPFEVL